MSSSFDVAIAGAGLAGSCAALTLSRTRRVVVLEPEAEPATRASGAAAGLANPLMGRRPRLAWRIDEALDALRTVLREAGAEKLLRENGIVRPAVTGKHAAAFREAAEEHPDRTAWIDENELAERHPAVRADGGGALLVRRGGAVDVPAMARALLAKAEVRGATVRFGAHLTNWRETPGGGVRISVNGAETLEAERLVLAPGAGFSAFPALDLDLEKIKGQTIRVRAPVGLDAGSLPFLSGSGYVVPDGDALVLGSTYERDFDDLAPSPDQSDYILQKTSRMLPALAEADVVEARAGVRVKVPNSRYPLLDRLARRVWYFGALGSKGLLTAPLLARGLPRFLGEPAALPREVTLGRD